MYKPAYAAPAAQPYTSPPPDPYRSSPVSVNPKQPYTNAFSPPPMPLNGNTFAPLAAAHSNRYQQYSNRPPQNQYAAPSPYANAYAQQPQQAPPVRHKGTLAPGQIVKVGEQAVRIERYLSEGGYAHVYLTSSDKPIYPPRQAEEEKGRWGERGYSEHCLKRIAFEDEAVWADVRQEIEVMKALPANPHLTQYLGSAHSRLPNGGYEVFILMEFCAGGGIIDLLNKRLRDRLKEIEILNIFTDVCEAVAAMHSLRRPLLHRDLKIENVLSQPTSSQPSSTRGTPLVYKLCDFGSTTFPAAHPPASKAEADGLALNLNKHTTLQYRSPEMVEPMLGWAVGLPSDVWALGVLLYKLCYYTTPFEEHGTLAIVNAKYTFPQFPVYSARLQHLIAAMLVEQPIRRPTVFEVLKMAHDMSGTRPEVDYPTPSRSFSAHTPSSQQAPSKASTSSSNLLDFTSPPLPGEAAPMQQSLVPTVQPGRRGRPARESSRTQVPIIQTPPVSQPPTLPIPQPVASNIANLPNAKASTPRLQVTGDKGKPEPPIISTQKVDAFGMPASSSASSSEKNATGFGDSFAAKSAKLGLTLQQSNSGLSDSFRSRPTSTPLSPRNFVPSPAPTPKFPTSFSRPKSTSPAPPTERQRAPSSSIPDGEISFETRFPSIETLSSGDTFSPPASGESISRTGSTQPQAPQNIASPITSPTDVRPAQTDSTQAQGPQNLVSPVTSPIDTRPSGTRNLSMMGSLTGAEHLSRQPDPGAKIDTPPQPRSTHVTGTAFTDLQGGMLSPSPVQAKTESFKPVVSNDVDQSSGVAATTTAKPSTPPDLLTGDDMSEQQVPSMRPTMTTAPLSSSSRALPTLPDLSKVDPPTSTAKPPVSGQTKPLLPLIDAAKPVSDSSAAEQRYGRQRSAKQISASPVTKKLEKEKDSSEDEGPEEASGANRRPSSPVRRESASRVPALPRITQRTSASEMQGVNRKKSQTRVPIKSATTPLPPDASSGRPPTLRLLSSERSRPQSMYAASPHEVSRSGTPNSSLSPSTTSTPVSSAPGRPRHHRKSSITDIVSRYESLQSPARLPDNVRRTSNDAIAAPSPSGTSGLSKKPSVLPKPAGLRKNTIDEQPKASKPVTIAPKPVRYGETPAPAGYSRSSSGRSFPVNKPAPAQKPTASVSAVATSSDEPTVEGKASSRQEVDTSSDGGVVASPEKQQPVNLLIQRWNQGGVNKPPAKRGNYI